MARIVVIGAGLGGLSVAARLSVKRHEVTVVERSDHVGGKAAQLSHDGFIFDTGPSLLTLPAVYRDLFLKTGASLEDSLDLMPVEPGTRYVFPDGTTLTLPGVGVAACANAFGDALGGSARSQWLGLMERAREIWRVTRRPILESPISGLADLRPLARNINDVRLVAPHRSMHALAKKYLSDDRLRMVLDRYATYAGSDPHQAPAALVTIPYVEQTFGQWHIAGGIATLATALAKRCAERGVTIQLGQDVTAITTDVTGVTGVELAGGEHLAADIVVANCDATVLYGGLVTDVRARKAREKLTKATPSLSGFSLMLAVRGRTPGIAHHNVWFPPNYRNEFREVFSGSPVTTPAIYACVPDDPAMRPNADSESWFILVNAPRQGTSAGTFNWLAPGYQEKYADNVLSQLAARGCDIRDRVMWRHIRTPADIAADTNSPGGAIYGTSSNGVRSAFTRPANVSPVPNLYLVGGSAHPGGGLPLVGLSAEIVANLIGRA